MARRIIVCDGAETARLWSRIGAADNEELTWVPRDDESRARPSGFRILQGGLTTDAFRKLDPEPGDEYALATDDGPWIRAAVPAISEISPEAPILLLTDTLDEDDLPDHPCLRRTGLKSSLTKCWLRHRGKKRLMGSIRRAASQPGSRRCWSVRMNTKLGGMDRSSTQYSTRTRFRGQGQENDAHRKSSLLR